MNAPACYLMLIAGVFRALGQHVPAEKVHPSVFRGAQRIFRRPKAHLFASQRHNKVLTQRKEKLAVRKLKNKMQKRLDKLNKLGVNYALPGHGNEIAEVCDDTGDSILYYNVIE